MPIRRIALLLLAAWLFFVPPVAAQDAAWLAKAAGAKVATPVAADTQLARTVAARLHAVPGYGRITVTATGGVVRLEGSEGRPDGRPQA